MSEELESELSAAVQILKLYEPQIDERLPKAKAGDRRSSLNLIAVAGGLVRAGFPLPPKLAEWLSLGLAGLAAGMSPEESFGFKSRKRGERVALTNVRISNERFRRAYLVEYLAQTKSISIEAACDAVAQIEHIDSETVNFAWDAEHVKAKMVLAVSLGDMYWVKETK